ncbi:MAG: B-box zinc finger protein [Silvibacterium sp.]|nr:B-box zinc finger protein [Silvibacterium sp.]
MNCANHPSAPVAAYCQNCGKALCSQCVRAVSGVIYCEQCLAAKLGIGGTGFGAPTGGAYAGTAPGSVPGAAYAVPGVVARGGPNPATAAALGFIPGVGAMYNGQFVKGLVHVLVFVVLVGISGNHGIFGIFIAAWVFYQVFDAYQTAKARRDGLPLPDPFGLNELGSKIGIPNSATTPQFTESYTAAPPPPPAGFTPVSDYGAQYPPYTDVPPAPPMPPGGGIPPVEPDPYRPVPRREPIGAIVLIGLGLLFLFNTLGIFGGEWLHHTWPILIIGLGAWLLIRRTRGAPPMPPPPGPPAGGGQ